MDTLISRRSRRWLLQTTALTGVAVMASRSSIAASAVAPAAAAAAAAAAAPKAAPEAAPAANLDSAGMPYAAFDRMPMDRLQIGGAVIKVVFGPGRFDLPRARILDHVQQSARTVAGFFGRFPAQTTRILILNTRSAGRPVRSGTAFGYGGAAIKWVLAAQVDSDDLERDWILVHEMSHLALPSLPRRHHWFEEGMATYVEPLARAQAGLLSTERVWSDLLKGLPQGLPEAGDLGLDNTPTWGRTYWGGALYCLLADLALREATSGRKGLQHALRAILDQGNIEQDAAIEPLLHAGDRATDTVVLATLYAQMKGAAYPVDLARIWAALGVRRLGSSVEFDDSAPLAVVRNALTEPLGLTA